MTLAVVAFVALLAIGVVVGVAVTARRRTSAVAGIGRDLVAQVPATTETIRLLERWRDRAARWRTVLALPVVVTVLVTSVAVRSSIDLGIGAHPAWSDPLLFGLLSVFLGAIGAELHHLRPRDADRRAAELVPRDLADHLPRGSRRRLAWLVIAAVVASVLAVVVGAVVVPWYGLVALAIAVAVSVVQRGIVLRGRPALGPGLRAADDAVRRLAVRSVDEAGAGAIVLLAAWQAEPAFTALSGPGPLEAAFVIAQLAALVTAIVWWRRSAPRRLLPDVRAALDAPDPAGRAAERADAP